MPRDVRGDGNGPSSFGPLVSYLTPLVNCGMFVGALKTVVVFSFFHLVFLIKTTVGSSNGVSLLEVHFRDSKAGELSDSRLEAGGRYISRGFIAEFYEVAAKILDDRSGLGVSRYGDGEVFIMKGVPIRKNTQAFQVDRFFFEGGESKLGSELRKSLTGLRGQEYYYCFGGCPHFPEIVHEVDQSWDKILAGTVFRDRNWAKARVLLDEIIEEESGNIVLFCNENAKPDSELPFAKLVVRFPGLCVQWFEKHGEEALCRAVAMARNTTRNTLFLFSIGPLSEVFIYHMFKANPRNRYVDFGSAINVLLTGKTNRWYMKPGNSLAQRKIPRWTIDGNGVVRNLPGRPR